MTTKANLPRIRILILDDNPLSLMLGGVPALPVEYRPFFEPLWLGTAEEAREFRDGCRAVAAVAPEWLVKAEVIPEILIFDYDLLKDKTRVEHRPTVTTADYERVGPLPRLGRALSQARLHLGPLDGPLACPQLSRMRHTDPSDNAGCFGGGLLLTTFSDHPCAGVPSTVWGHEKTKGTEAAIFEWFLKRDANGTFEEKGRPLPNWTELINYALPQLRRQIEKLDDCGLITLSVDDLLNLTSDTKPEILRCWSRYGLRELPIHGLFADKPTEIRSKEIHQWALDRLRSLLGKSHSEGTTARNSAQEELRLGQRMADTVWNAFNSDLPLRRERLDDLLAIQDAKGDLTLEERDELARENEFFGYDKAQGKATKHTCTIASVGANEPRAMRWAILFLIVRLHCLKDVAVRNYEKYSAKHGHTYIQPFTHIAATDIFCVLFPVPDDYPSNHDFSAKYSHILRRLKSPDLPPLPSSKNDHGNLAIVIADLLAGKPWQANAEHPRSEWSYGLKPGERYILRSYALQFGLLRSDGKPFLEAIF